ncbi:LemA family protein [Burkholderia sp. H160]|nr:LemA family protein [Burkholderia sp. H160]
MSPAIVTLLVLLGVGLLLALWLMGIYNRLVVARNRFENAFAQIDVQHKRRYDLIPNLVEAVKGYMGHERQTLDAVIKARNSAMAAEQKVAAKPSDPAAMRQCGNAGA